jgi:hypothetical protein
MHIKTGGFTLFYAMLVGSLALAVGLAIYDLTIRELDLSATATQSQYAIYAADTGAECALYWDGKYVNVGNNNNGGSNSAFATSSLDTLAPASGILCNGQDVAAVGTPPSPYQSPPTNWTAWAVATPIAPTPTAATTTFSIVLTPQSYCAVVTVAKYNGTPSQTTVTSNGFNTCAPGALQLERALQVTY